LIKEDEAHFGRPLTAAELAAIDGDINRVCFGGQWIEWAGYHITRCINGMQFTSRKEAEEFFTAEREALAPGLEAMRRRDAIIERALAKAPA
jgi:hypothetical protein